MAKRRARTGPARARPAAPPPAHTAPSSPSRARAPAVIFALIVVACLGVAVAYVAFAVVRSPFRAAAAPTISASHIATEAPIDTPASSLLEPTSGPRAATEILFQNVERDNGYAQVASVSALNPGGERTLTGLTCERVHFAAEHGLCLVPDYGVIANYYAVVFDSNFRELNRIPIGGAPTRTRVSPDGRVGAATVFVFGHSYADVNFSTTTLLIDMASGGVIDNLENFTTRRGGQVWQAQDFNFWGVTFSGADSNTFYATLRTGGQTYLVKGDIEERSLEVLHENVECPSLSPDGTRIGYKRLGEGLVGQWRLNVLDLETMTETPVAETRNIDDQVEWLDNNTIIYGDGEDIWSVPADGSGTASKLIEDGLSPAVVR